ncbi:MAG: hypothetical protein ACNA8K_00110 [Cyclonatronaceae bacterium]
MGKYPPNVMLSEGRSPKSKHVGGSEKPLRKPMAPVAPFPRGYALRLQLSLRKSLRSFRLT